MNTAIELTYNINATAVSLGRRPRSLAVSVAPEPNLNLFPTAIQNGHINLIIRCVIRLADERLSLDGIKSVCPLFVDRHRSIKLGRAMVMAHSDADRRGLYARRSRTTSPRGYVTCAGAPGGAGGSPAPPPTEYSTMRVAFVLQSLNQIKGPYSFFNSSPTRPPQTFIFSLNFFFRSAIKFKLIYC